ncbi:MAG: T9SS type A sorting domain-containing protein [Mariniphaga sp.]|nr:T9SS type A sorting domain-containing protein [Mariniphaga sp.]
MVKWTLLNNSGNFNINELGLYCTVSARSDLANDTDSLILRASSRIGDVYTDVVIYLPNSLSAEKIIDNEAMKIYPNPVKDKLMVEVRKNDKLEIYNAAGTKVMEKIMDAGWNEIPVHHLTNGVYTVKVGNNPGQLIIKE